MVTEAIEKKVVKREVANYERQIRLEKTPKTDQQCEIKETPKTAQQYKIKETPKIIRQYEILEVLGVGTSGIVYRGYDQLDRRNVAIKQYHGAHISIPQNLQHPMLPTLYDSLVENGIYYLVMEYIEGMSLEQMLQKESKQVVNENQLIAWMCSILDLFAYLHGQTPPVLYQDLKPSNLILQLDGKLRLIDLDAMIRMNCSELAEQKAGTKEYASPEQQGILPGYQVSPVSDIYTCGRTLQKILMTIPVKHKTEKNGQLNRICQKASAYMPENRYQTALEMKQELEKLYDNFLTRKVKSVKNKLGTVICTFLPVILGVSCCIFHKASSLILILYLLLGAFAGLAFYRKRKYVKDRRYCFGPKILFSEGCAKGRL